ncbi:tRNA methyltransferase 1 [Boothiomyces sp. JEL0866]|nr:tRNA methyltransferase 1 [Boothiomyces sp. JEL0866]
MGKEEIPKWLILNEDGTKSVKEGSAEIIFDDQVFYNPIQEFNRDMSIAAIKVWSQIYLKEKLQKKNKKLELDQDIYNVNVEDFKSDFTEKQLKKRNLQVKSMLESADISQFKPVNVEHGAFDEYGFTIMEALSASGLRSVRYAKEIPKVSKILTNDLSKDAVKAIERNSKHNKVDGIVQPNHGDACKVLYTGPEYDVIDLDPYGSAAPFLDSAVQAVADGGLLCVTCTDLAVLAGSQPESCWAKYGGMNIPQAPYTHELALRILLHSIQSIASRYKKAIVPLISCHIDYYVRVFVRVYNSAQLMKQSSSKTSMIYHCQQCKSFETQTIGKYSETDKGPKFGPSALDINSSCQHCSHKMHIAGPFYSHPIHNPEFVSRMLGHIATNQSKYGTWERMAGMVMVISEELPNPLYYVLPRMCGVMKCVSPSLTTFISGLLSAGYKVSQSHAMVQAIKTDAPSRIVWDVIRQWCKENPQKGEISETSPAKIIMSKDISTKVSFEIRKDAVAPSSKFNLVRFQENPTANWGPKVFYADI